jgi:hypothetical protein
MEFVRSHYRAPWKGVVLTREKRTRGGRFGRIDDLLTVLVLVDRHGNPMRKRHVATLSASWTTPCDAFDVSWVPKNWGLQPPSSGKEPCR